MNWRGGRKRHKPMAEINVVPYIDVSLVLLVIFMMTAPLLESEVGIDLPQADAQPLSPTADAPIIVTLKADGGLFVALGGDEAKAVDNAGLREMVLAALQAQPGRAVL
ncbi:MAG: biopolymer transporter ExbD, partial [Candidatus Methylumidiphilus sp.]